MTISVNGASKDGYENTYTTNNYQKTEGNSQKTDSWATLPVETKTAVETEYPNSNLQVNASAKNGADEETTFPIVRLFRAYEERIKALQEHYAKANEENKSFPSPEGHIWDKYYNSRSPYYVKGLTQRERAICREAELNVLYGKTPPLNSYDPVIQEQFGGCNIFVTDMETNIVARNELNDAIRRILKEYGITIPADADMRLTVNPYDYFISVSGVDEGLAKRIEEALNKGKNGYYLWCHISYCNPVNYNVDEPVQYITGDKGKMAVWHLVNKLTGYDLRELERKDGRFLTPDGEDLWTVLKAKYSEIAANDSTEAFGLGNYYKDYDRLARLGFDYSADCDLSLGYKNGSLYDIGMDDYGYGPGQTAWQDRVKEWYKEIHEQYRREREETLRREESMPTPFEATLSQIELNESTDSEGELIGEMKRANLSALQELLNQLMADGLLSPLTDNILSLRAKQVAIQGAVRRFDSKA